MSHGSPDPEYPMHITVCKNLRNQYFAAVMVWDKHGERFMIAKSGPTSVSKDKAKDSATVMASLMQLEVR